MANGSGRVRLGNTTLAKAFYATGPSPTRSLHIATLEDPDIACQANFDDVLISYDAKGMPVFQIGSEEEENPVRHLKGDPMGVLDGLRTKRQYIALSMGFGVILNVVWCQAVRHHSIFMEIGQKKTWKASLIPNSNDRQRVVLLAKFIQGKL
jgi:hypothetical protein